MRPSSSSSTLHTFLFPLFFWCGMGLKATDQNAKGRKLSICGAKICTIQSVISYDETLKYIQWKFYSHYAEDFFLPQFSPVVHVYNNFL